MAVGGRELLRNVPCRLRICMVYLLIVKVYLLLIKLRGPQ